MEDANWGPSDYHGTATRGTLDAFYRYDAHQRFGGGIEYNKYEASDTWNPTASYDNRAVWGSYRYIWDELLGARTIFDATVRYDEFSTFENKATYRFGLKRECKLLPGFFTAANLTSAYKAPSLYQYSTNTALTPESTDGFEISAGYKELLKLTYFRNKVKDRIDYDFGTWSYFNSPQSYTVDGIEIEGSYPIDAIDTVISANYTHLFDPSYADGSPILRVPENSANLFVDYYLSDTIHLGANLQYVDKRRDYGNVELGSYTLVNLSYNQRIGANLTLSVQAHNIFDEDYETAYGYSTEGRSVYAKMEYRF
jgi:vitamin B12 transporter